MNKLIAVILGLALVLSGCSKGEDVSYEDKGFVDDSYYLSVEELDKIKDDENLIIIDARENKDYQKGHIEGAINVTWQQLSNVSVKSDEEGFGVVLPPSELEVVLQDLGLNNDSRIVIYSNAQDGWGEDGRILWTLKLNGIDNVQVLDGSYEYYKDAGYQTSKESVELAKGDVELNSYNADIVIDSDELETLISQDEVVVIDTRSKSEFNGATKYGETQGGHLPGAVNIPLEELFNDHGRVKSKAEVEQILSDAGISKDDYIVTYCTAGIRSSYVYVVLKSYGYENVRNYDESYYRWSAINEVE